MEETTQKALNNAAASSAMEGLPLSQADLQIITDILDGKATLQEYLKQLKAQCQEA